MKTSHYLTGVIVLVMIIFFINCSKSSSFGSNNQKDIKLYSASLSTIQQSIKVKWLITYKHGNYL